MRQIGQDIPQLIDAADGGMRIVNRRRERTQRNLLELEDAKGKELAQVSQTLARTALSKIKNPAFILCSTS